RQLPQPLLHPARPTAGDPGRLGWRAGDRAPLGPDRRRCRRAGAVGRLLHRPALVRRPGRADAGGVPVGRPPPARRRGDRLRPLPPPAGPALFRLGARAHRLLPGRPPPALSLPLFPAPPGDPGRVWGGPPGAVSPRPAGSDRRRTTRRLARLL